MQLFYSSAVSYSDRYGYASIMAAAGDDGNTGNTGGRVLATFTRGVCLLSDAGALTCIGATTLDDGPLNVVCRDWPTAAVRPGQRWRYASGLLDLGTLRIRRLAAPAWRPPPPPAPAALIAGRRALADAFSRLNNVPNAGLLFLLPALLAPYSVPARILPVAATDTPLARHTRDALQALDVWLRSTVNTAPAPFADAATLIGLGPGLTPSGDDFLAGLGVTLGALDPARQRRLSDWLLPQLTQRTGLISAAHLRCAVRDGAAAAPLHRLLAALAGDDAAALSAALRAQIAVGHSSGGDALCGLLYGLTLAAPAPLPAPVV